MFTAQNTEGFTAQDLNMMNAAHAALTADGIDAQSAADIVNNNWQASGNSVESLARV